ncbi:hypothetical protein C8F04DRAFT_1177355 [Mycena alexandri]|uniref:Uncharacterized protein n=1 Tax=Mycena alexandri TaxID=1745969 RepID=A0AAD6TB53_9AGAR|nr:hypothetical protein C8F04DRAFT_1177355 [Mycena alexandri]
MSNLPALWCSCAPLSLFGALLPTFYLNPGLNWQWKWRNQVYSKCRLLTIAIVPYLSGAPHFYTCSLEVARQIVSIYAHVWEKRLSMRQMVEAEGRSDKTVHYVPAINKITISPPRQAALILISRCAFGQPLLCYTLKTRRECHSCLQDGCTHFQFKGLRDMERAYTSLAPFMKKLLRPSGRSNVRKDVFRLMIRASEVEGALRMSDDERKHLSDALRRPRQPSVFQRRSTTFGCSSDSVYGHNLEIVLESVIQNKKNIRVAGYPQARDPTRTRERGYGYGSARQYPRETRGDHYVFLMISWR